MGTPEVVEAAGVEPPARASAKLPPMATSMMTKKA
jgi:hypothetical protein